jgi:hypothetical protein
MAMTTGDLRECGRGGCLLREEECRMPLLASTGLPIWLPARALMFSSMRLSLCVRRFRIIMHIALDFSQLVTAGGWCELDIIFEKSFVFTHVSIHSSRL